MSDGQAYTRQAHLERASDDGRFPAVVATEAPVDRGDFEEVLDLSSPAAVDLERSPLPLIESHDGRQLNIGLVEDLRVVGRKLRGMVRLGNSQRAKEVARDIRDGIIRSLSIGYRWLDWHREGDQVLVRRWMPLEVSLVAIPADPNAGLFRHYQTPKENIMSDNTPAPESPTAPRHERKSAAEERERVTAILKLGEMHDCLDLARQFVETGRPVEHFQEAILERLGWQHTPMPAADVWDQGNDLFGRSLDRYSLTRLIAALADPSSRQHDAGFELEVSQELQHRYNRKSRGVLVPTEIFTRTVTSSGSGSNLIGTQHMDSEMVDLLRNRSIVLSLGARRIDGLVGDVSIPRQTGSTTAYWIAGDGADSITASDPAYDSITLSPKTVAALTGYSHKMLVQSAPGIEQLLREDLSAKLADEIDKQAIQGDGTGNKPTGILNTTGIGSNTYALGGKPSFADIVTLESDLAVANADRGALAYAVHPGLISNLKTTEVASGSGRFIYEGGSAEGRMNGLRALFSGNVTDGYVVLGDWSQLIVGTWSGVEILVNPFTDDASGNVRVRAMMDVDVAVRHVEAFSELHESTV